MMSPKYYRSAIEDRILRSRIADRHLDSFVSQDAGSSISFFILSSGRSGSTFLRRLMEDHPEVSIPPESGDALIKAARSFIKGVGSSWEVRVERIIDAFFREMDVSYWKLDPSEILNEIKGSSSFEHRFDRIVRRIYETYTLKAQTYPPPKLIGDKTPFLIYRMDWLKLLFPEALFIFMVRDGRDVVHSMVSRMGVDLKDACRRWNSSMKQVERFHQDRGIHSLLVYYEDLIRDPDKELARIFSELGLSDHGTDIDPRAMFHRDLGDTVLPHHAKSKEGADLSKIEEWRKMDQEYIGGIEKWIGKRLEKWGYK